jgi:hypothetical protein
MLLVVVLECDGQILRSNRGIWLLREGGVLARHGLHEAFHQPTICRLNRSMMTARYSQPSAAATYEMSLV